ncbi:MAG: DUF4215 domain-containing protein [Planctomycetales bacterium]|nr:DUF4215 domain-containing protein [Planctomycetales bacterium]
MFQAERHTTQSNYKLTLSGFTSSKSICDDLCGDGIVTRFEACDDGKNDGSYGSCTADCLGFGPRCGDGKVDAGSTEECDDGNATNGDGCSAACLNEGPT